MKNGKFKHGLAVFLAIGTSLVLFIDSVEASNYSKSELNATFTKESGYVVKASNDPPKPTTPTGTGGGTSTGTTAPKPPKCWK